MTLLQESLHSAQTQYAFSCLLLLLESICLSVAAGSLGSRQDKEWRMYHCRPPFSEILQVQVMVIDHDPEEAATHGVVDTPHGGVEVPAEAHKDAQGRSMRPHNQPQPPTPPCYAPVHGDADHDHSF